MDQDKPDNSVKINSYCSNNDHVTSTIGTLGRIMLFIPAYNCEKQLLRVLRSLAPEVAALFVEIVVIENRSQDGTVQAAKLGLSEITVTKTTLLQNKENYSLGGSHKVAFNYMLEQGYDYVVVLHGDDQGDIHDLIPLLKRGEHLNYDVLLGSRFEPESKLVGYSRFRIFGNLVLNSILSLLMRVKITDMGSGLNVYSRNFLASKSYLGFPNDLTFNIYLLFYGILNHSRYCFFPLSWKESDQISNARMFRQAFKILMLTVAVAIRPSYLGHDFVLGKTDYKSNILYQQGKAHA